MTRKFWTIRRRHSTLTLPRVVSCSSMDEIKDSIGDDDGLSSNSSNSSFAEEDTATVLVTEPFDKKKRQSPKWRQPVDVESYMTKREMTETQERWNAITMLPCAMFCIYFLLSAQWLGASTTSSDSEDLSVLLRFHESFGCLSPTWWHSMPCLPPLPVMAVAFGITVHAPFSFLYHWSYAHKLPAATRTKHWSRRLDQMFVHVCSIFMCLGTTINVHYILANAIYNFDCMVQHVRADVKPRRNQIRIGLSLLLYSAPMMMRDPRAFGELWLVFATSIWFFVAYPIGGWSHSVFHLILALGPPLTLASATQISDLSFAQTCLQMQRAGNLP